MLRGLVVFLLPGISLKALGPRGKLLGEIACLHQRALGRLWGAPGEKDMQICVIHMNSLVFKLYVCSWGAPGASRWAPGNTWNAQIIK